ncbi:MAG: flagellar basal-body rod protein FlgG [Candidatus Omnitrophica bacterium]|nr:flagellar basal-body rod protein FlgG [Candidatus Omnitrophota bacterium]
MIRSLYTSATGMEAQEMAIDIISNNLANVNTTGFKKSRVDFQDLLYETIRAAGTDAAAGVQFPTGLQVGHGTKPVSTQKIFTQGEFIQTQNPLDMTIEGAGFFQIQRADGTVAYSRDGAFKIDSEGRLVNSDGFIVQPEITIPTNAQEVSIAMDGTVTAVISGETTPQNLGTLELAKFINPAGLKSLGRNMFEETEASGSPTVAMPGTEGVGTLAQGFLEMSNVKVVEEMVNMIVAQRAYEMNAKTIQASDDMLRQAATIRR